MLRLALEGWLERERGCQMIPGNLNAPTARYYRLPSLTEVWKLTTIRKTSLRTLYVIPSGKFWITRSNGYSVPHSTSRAHDTPTTRTLHSPEMHCIRAATQPWPGQELNLDPYNYTNIYKDDYSRNNPVATSTRTSPFDDQ